MFSEGIYEQLINHLVAEKLAKLDANRFYIGKAELDKAEASQYLSQYIQKFVRHALDSLPNENRVHLQIELCNEIIELLKYKLQVDDFSENLIQTEGNLLIACFSKLNPRTANLKEYIQKITPLSGLSYTQLFTGSNVGISLESEIRKEILSSDEIYLLVSFIKWTGIRIFESELRKFTEEWGKPLRVITTSYMGATDLKAIEFLSELPNTEIKVSYNNQHERLHAKAYLFLRDTGFHTGYIGSSNISRSALTNGLEWNLKITNQDSWHIIDKFRQTFDTYWNNQEFEPFDRARDRVKLKEALREQGSTQLIKSFHFNIQPYPFQKEILEKLEVERQIYGSRKNLIVAATGTGKTVISAFDYKRFKEKYPANSRLLFVAHRKEILEQSVATFRGILREGANFGDLWVQGYTPDRYDHLFISVQTFANNQTFFEERFSRNFYDFIIIDEVHHIAASSYRPILNSFTPQILLGLTATPERMDGANILEDFNDRIAAEIRLPEAINRGLLSPFQYFGIADVVDLNRIPWERGGYRKSELEKAYVGNRSRMASILHNLEKHLNDFQDVQALAFCVSQAHAENMAEEFALAGLKAAYLTSETKQTDRDVIKSRLVNREINYLFVVDIFNEGVDIPEIDTVLFLRPTESLTIFLQQLGRGLRLMEGKECLTVLDFVGMANKNYDFESKFRALAGKTHRSVIKEVEEGFPHLPVGCSILLEEKARKHILNNIKNATQFRTNQIINKVANFQHQSTLLLSLRNFLAFNHMDIRFLYKNKDWSWKKFCAEAGLIQRFNEPNEKEIGRAIRTKLIHTQCQVYLTFLLELIAKQFVINRKDQSTRLMAQMFHYDIWQNSGPESGFSSLEESLKALRNNPNMVSELREVIEFQLGNINMIQKPVELPNICPLQIHGRYTRDQILAAFELHTFEEASSNREGTATIKAKNTELLFVTLKKSEKDYSPTTLYEDYVISDQLFHWQSQNSAAPHTRIGKSYIEQATNRKRILLFVREQSKDEFGFTMSFIFLGEVNYQKHYGEKPMSITWQLEEPIPAYLWHDAAKLAIG